MRLRIPSVEKAGDCLAVPSRLKWGTVWWRDCCPDRRCRGVTPTGSLLSCSVPTLGSSGMQNREPDQTPRGKGAQRKAPLPPLQAGAGFSDSDSPSCLALWLLALRILQSPQGRSLEVTLLKRQVLRGNPFGVLCVLHPQLL